MWRARIESDVTLRAEKDTNAIDPISSHVMRLSEPQIDLKQTRLLHQHILGCFHGSEDDETTARPTSRAQNQATASDDRSEVFRLRSIYANLQTRLYILSGIPLLKAIYSSDVRTSAVKGKGLMLATWG
jgi:hypothetical protein